ncbi:hypothetical protein A3F00_00310 [Candidatus Daviesbacteria bacterium RIFCSPHIGHO2_12_FULL_37_11]|uniref:Uncharacterized protein n=1 Tax=Candidatus Daviesbacteria bacterium RIFCSPHIGHO2_12_FULL_37_11 TaxID=1797777 RepID=A0A1F5KAG8_9BACT|nr:MAG: hypothetical protein A2111_01405 [Candidatus Daviesbacteria bacterium GWA1_38_6]OGE16273.1 MAG: hypothetical protein A2769_03295 [Candidatus Daviesbacteria bacterium RIFCSPHIGHO2_01_FULL_37_27]OGE37936.1 MAG: hypothetical protein A3F00_00310 [Candidatus Daviesbacteria bacterium RIFCSPHIGHO2_12_FULL_37_11]OGE45270.1 MAG: hypothetical protein A3B39_04055 [Candidatus Daviesbacteria bacterium RIFCSPLOWO2_01_FULL_37_10]
MLKNFRKNHQYLFFVFIGASVVLFWRGIWGLMDLYLFPENQSLSYISSLLIAAALLFITHSWTKLKN